MALEQPILTLQVVEAPQGQIPWSPKRDSRAGVKKVIFWNATLAKFISRVRKV
jgi:hypothetical protein